MKLSVGLTKKLGLPHYSSVAASCYVELELDQSLVFLDLDAFYERVRKVYAVCRQSVAEELAHQRASATDGESNGPADPDHTVNGKDSTLSDSGRPASRAHSATSRDWPSRSRV